MFSHFFLVSVGSSSILSRSFVRESSSGKKDTRHTPINLMQRKRSGDSHVTRFVSFINRCWIFLRCIKEFMKSYWPFLLSRAGRLRRRSLQVEIIQLPLKDLCQPVVEEYRYSYLMSKINFYCSFFSSSFSSSFSSTF